MNKNLTDIERRRNDLIKKIESSNKPTTRIITEFARQHYLSEKTIWNDYTKAKGSKKY